MRGRADEEKLKKLLQSRRRWLMPVIVATQETKIRRITVQSQPQANNSRDPISKKTHHKKGLVEWLKV
jgi:hypothetical protein